MAACSSCGKLIIWPDNPVLKNEVPLCPSCKPQMYSGEAFIFNGFDINLFFIDWKNGAECMPVIKKCPFARLLHTTWGDYMRLCNPCEHRRACWNQEERRRIEG